MKKLIFTAVLLALPSVSQAAVFTDNFDGDTLALNQDTFLGGWTVLGPGTVDLIGNPGFFDFLPGNGRYVDLDGSTPNLAGGFDKQLALAASTTYTLSFDLAGSQRSDTNIVDVTFGTNSQTFTLASSDPFATYTLSFTTNAAANYQIFFHNRGGDNLGALLDNVSVTAAVPEPETYMMMLGGLGLIGFAARRRKT